jgi:beta-galactosidase
MRYSMEHCNEVPEQRDSGGAKTAEFLTNIVHDADPTRPATAGFNDITSAIKNGLADVVDVVGFNYSPDNYVKVHQAHPDWKILGRETESTINSRGEYMFPVIERKSHKYPNKQMNAYDLDTPSWGKFPIGNLLYNTYPSAELFKW